MRGILFIEELFPKVVSREATKMRRFAFYRIGETLFIKEPVGFISGIMFRKYDHAPDSQFRKDFNGWMDERKMPENYARYHIEITKRKWLFAYEFEFK